MEYDNVRDRHKHGFDAGQIVDGEVTKDPDTGRFVIVDDEGVAFDPQAALGTLEGEQVRLTMVSHRSIQRAQDLMDAARDEDPQLPS